MEETTKKPIKYVSVSNCLEDEDGDVLTLYDACEMCLREDEYTCKENLDELARMFPSFNEFQFNIFCTLLTPKLADGDAEILGTDLLKTPTRNLYSENVRIESLYQMLFWGIIYSPEPSKDIIQDSLKLSEHIVSNIRLCRDTPFEVKTCSPVFSFILPCNLNEEKLFYNPDILDSLSEMRRYLEPGNFKKLQEHFHKSGRNLSITCLLEGPSGTGKTAFVRELARSTGRPILFADIAKLRGKDYGHDERMARMLFEEYKFWYWTMPVKPILFVDECDTVLSSRQNPDGNVNSVLVNCHNTVTEIWLQELDNFEGILFLTTNNTSHIDTAIARRITHQINIGHPNYETQVKIWKQNFPEMTEMNARELANDTNFTGGQIFNVKRKVQLKEVLDGPVPFEELLRISSTNGRILKRNPVGFSK